MKWSRASVNVVVHSGRIYRCVSLGSRSKDNRSLGPRGAGVCVSGHGSCLRTPALWDSRHGSSLFFVFWPFVCWGNRFQIFGGIRLFFCPLYLLSAATLHGVHFFLLSVSGDGLFEDLINVWHQILKIQAIPPRMWPMVQTK